MSEELPRISGAAWTGELPSVAKASPPKAGLAAGRAAAVALVMLALAVFPLKALYQGVTTGLIPVGPDVAIPASQPGPFLGVFTLWIAVLVLCSTTIAMLVIWIRMSLRARRP